MRFTLTAQPIDQHGGIGFDDGRAPLEAAAINDNPNTALAFVFGSIAGALARENLTALDAWDLTLEVRP